MRMLWTIVLSAASEVDFEVYPCSAEESKLVVDEYDWIEKLTLSFLNDPSTIVIGTK